MRKILITAFIVCLVSLFISCEFLLPVGTITVINNRTVSVVLTIEYVINEPHLVAHEILGAGAVRNFKVDSDQEYFVYIDKHLSDLPYSSFEIGYHETVEVNVN